MNYAYAYRYFWVCATALAIAMLAGCRTPSGICSPYVPTAFDAFWGGLTGSRYCSEPRYMGPPDPVCAGFHATHWQELCPPCVGPYGEEQLPIGPHDYLEQIPADFDEDYWMEPEPAATLPEPDTDQPPEPDSSQPLEPESAQPPELPLASDLFEFELPIEQPPIQQPPMEDSPLTEAEMQFEYSEPVEQFEQRSANTFRFTESISPVDYEEHEDQPGPVHLDLRDADLSQPLRVPQSAPRRETTLRFKEWCQDLQDVPQTGG